MQKCAETRFLVKGGDYIYIPSFLSMSYDDAFKIVQDIESSGELANVQLPELSQLKQSTCNEVSLLLNQLYDGQLQSNYLVYEQSKHLSLNSLLQQNLSK